ncbi:Cyclic pyranopterin monophosphate synthase [Commensalibacter sp. Nvir]|uniref:cyclic pyranopterin monophosphate synthase MoaC n=1 Tax=Commensalibacter sp. Nvir TaxID=3069817 RepID=UPI002D28C7A2|nr:Cyclic pyranopterin monophosphate synthase [Commensalibacter sp. Nvir]
MSELTHFNKSGQAHMVDISLKQPTKRKATATGSIKISPKAYKLVKQGNSQKGDILGIARIAAIQGSKQTSNLIPLCHPLPLTHINVSFTCHDEQYRLTLQVIAETEGKTGVEMEALTAVSVGLLTIYDMLKAVDKAMAIESIYLIEKHGGKSGDWKRSEIPLC